MNNTSTNQQKKSNQGELMPQIDEIEEEELLPSSDWEDGGGTSFA
jgi:hypothetical protein